MTIHPPKSQKNHSPFKAPFQLLDHSSFMTRHYLAVSHEHLDNEHIEFGFKNAKELPEDPKVAILDCDTNIFATLAWDH
jgi:hypothetical protein